MGFWSRLLGADATSMVDTYDAAQRVLPEPFEPWMGYGSIPSPDPGVPFSLYRQRSAVAHLWRTQPNVRKVVDFIARNVASIPLHVFERVSDTDRRRVKDGPLAAVIGSPQARVAPIRFWHAIISDGLLYDRWAALKVPTASGGLDLVRVPAWRLRLRQDGLGRVVGAAYWTGDADVLEDTREGWQELDLDALVFDHGYAPMTAGLSPLDTLSDVLAETSEAVRYRRQLWANGPRVPAYMSRPPEAPEWSDEAKQRFATGFRAAYSGDGEHSGGMPLLEDGMRIEPLNVFTPQDAMDLEGRRLTAIEVAAAYHIAPELVGAQQGNYSNVREYRQMLYRDSLGPYIVAWEGAINAQLTPDLAGGRPLYVEANVESKLRGSFEEQAQMLSTAIGAPWMTRGEARGRMNLPEIDGADDLVVPLNVLVGGQASPRDSGSQNRTSASAAKPAKSAVKSVKAAPSETHEERAAQVLAAFFSRQARVVKSRLGSKDAEWWDAERWDAELADDLYRLAVLVSQDVATKTLEGIGFGPDEYDMARTLAFLKAVSERVAGQVNATTLEQLEAALDEDDPQAAVSHVFEQAETSRAGLAAATVVTTFAGFATTEAAKQVAPGRTTKTWVVNSKNPRASHARLNGETVGVEENFSNGAAWPGDIALTVDDRAGCKCSLVINVE